MEIQVSPEVQKAIEGLAAQNGTSPAEQAGLLLADAVERWADYDRWFRAQVGEARAASKAGEFMEHAEVGRMIDGRFPG
jgi:predicted transcriptional regulator